MKNCKMAFTIGLVFAVMMLVAACTDSNKSDNHIFDHESLDVDEYVYPSDFDLGEDVYKRQAVHRSVRRSVCLSRRGLPLRSQEKAQRLQK